MEPLSGLKMSCASRLPIQRSHSSTPSRLGEPTGRPKESDSIMKMPSVPGEGAQPKPLPGSRPRVVDMYPAAQSPMTLKAASPLATISVACCQDSEAASALVYCRLCPKRSHTATASGAVNGSSPVQSCCHFSGPSTASATFSHRCVAVQFSPKDSGMTPFACKVGAMARNSSHVRGTLTPQRSRFSGTYQSTLERWMLTGTDQTPSSVLKSEMSPAGNTSYQPCSSKRKLRSSIRRAMTHVPMSSCPACTWNVPGGSPPSMRVLSTALALTPAPPVTVALLMRTPGLRFSNSAIMASRAGPSSPAHQEKISTSPVAWAKAAAGSASKTETRPTTSNRDHRAFIRCTSLGVRASGWPPDRSHPGAAPFAARPFLRVDALCFLSSILSDYFLSISFDLFAAASHEYANTKRDQE